MAAANQIDNVFNLIFKGISPQLFPKDLQEDLFKVLSKSTSPDQMAEDIAKWRRSVLDGSDDTIKISEETREFLGESATVARLASIPKVHDVATKFNELITSNVDQIDVDKLLDGLRGNNSPLPDGDIKAIEDVFKESIEVRENTIKQVMEDFGVTREQALDGYAREMARDAGKLDSSANDVARTGDEAIDAAKQAEEAKIIESLTSDLKKRVQELLDNPEMDKITPDEFGERMNSFVTDFHTKNAEQIDNLSPDGQRLFMEETDKAFAPVKKLYDDDVRLRGNDGGSGTVGTSSSAAKAGGKIYDDFPEFNPKLDFGKVIRHIGLTDTIIPLPKIYLYPVKAMRARSMGITRPVQDYIDSKMSGLGIKDGLRKLNNDVLETVKNGGDPKAIIEEFAKTNKSVLEEFSENMRQLKEHIERTYKTNAEMNRDGLDQTRWTYDLTIEQKDALLRYVKDMEKFPLDVALGLEGKNGQEILKNLELVKNGELNYRKVKESVTGLSRSAEIANYQHMRETGKWLDGSGKSRSHYNEKILRGINEGFYTDKPYVGDPLVLNKNINENIEKTWQDFVEAHTELDSDGHLKIKLGEEVEPIREFITDLTTIMGKGLNEEAMTSARQVTRILQEELRSGTLKGFPDGGKFMSNLKTLRFIDGNTDARTLEVFKKIADIFEEGRASMDGAPNDTFLGFRERFLDSNRFTKTHAERSGYYWETAERFGNPDSFWGSLGLGYPAEIGLRARTFHFAWRAPLAFITGGQRIVPETQQLTKFKKNYYGAYSEWKFLKNPDNPSEGRESFTSPLKRAATRWGSGFTVSDTKGSYNPLKWEYNKLFAYPAAGGMIYGAGALALDDEGDGNRLSYMWDNKGDILENPFASFGTYPLRLGWGSAYDYAYEGITGKPSTPQPTSSTTTTNSVNTNQQSSGQTTGAATGSTNNTNQQSGGSVSGSGNQQATGNTSNNTAGANSNQQSGGQTSGAGTTTGQKQPVVDNRPKWEKELDAPKAEAAALLASIHSAAGNIDLYISSKNASDAGSKRILEAIEKQEQDVLLLQRELSSEGRRDRADTLNSVLKDIRFGKIDAQGYAIQLENINKETQLLKAEAEKIEKQIREVDNFNDAKNLVPDLMAQLKDKTKEIEAKRIEAKQLLDNIRDVGKSNADRMNLNQDIRYRFGNAHQLDEALKKWGGEQGLPYQFFGKGQSNVSSVAGGMLETAWNSVKGVGDWWGDVKRSARTQSDRNMYNMIETGVGIFASIGLFNFINDKLFDNKVQGIAKWGIIIGIVGAFMARSGTVGAQMANNADSFSPFFSQTNSGYAANSRTTSRTGNGHIPVVPTGSNNGSTAGSNGSNSNVTALIRDRNGNAVNHIIYVDGKMTTQNHNGGLPKTANDIIVDKVAAEKVNSAVQQDLNRIKAAMSGKGSHLPNPLKGEIDVVINKEGTPPQRVTIDYTVSNPETADLTRPR